MCLLLLTATAFAGKAINLVSRAYALVQYQPNSWPMCISYSMLYMYATLNGKTSSASFAAAAAVQCLGRESSMHHAVRLAVWMSGPRQSCRCSVYLLQALSALVFTRLHQRSKLKISCNCYVVVHWLAVIVTVVTAICLKLAQYVVTSRCKRVLQQQALPMLKAPTLECAAAAC